LIDFEHKVHILTNTIRQQHGLASLIWSEELARAARTHSRDLATSNTFSHTGTDSTTPEQRVQATGKTMRFLGENICGGRNSPEAAIMDWMNSPGHRVNILNPDAVYLGVGFAYSENSRYRFYVTQVFGK